MITVCSVSFSVYADEEVSEEGTAAEESVTDEDDGYLTTEDGNYKYSFESSEESGEKYVVLEEYLGNEESVVIPEEIDGIKVTKIGDYAFNEKEFIKILLFQKISKISVTIPFTAVRLLPNLKLTKKMKFTRLMKTAQSSAKTDLRILFIPAEKIQLKLRSLTVLLQFSPVHLQFVKSLKRSIFRTVLNISDHFALLSANHWIMW